MIVATRHVPPVPAETYSISGLTAREVDTILAALNRVATDMTVDWSLAAEHEILSDAIFYAIEAVA